MHIKHRILIALLSIACLGSVLAQQETLLFPFIMQDVSASQLPEIVLQDRNAMDVEVVDIDGDDDPDIVLAIEFYKNVILLNDGTGVFKDGSGLLPDKVASIVPPPYRYYPYHDSEDIAIVDFDRDGDLDIIIVTEDDKTNEYYVKNDEGGYVDVSSSFPVEGTTNGITAADFNNDGWIDVILANNGQDELLLNNKGQFNVVTSTHFPISEDITQDIEVADIDGDGDTDVIIGNENDNKAFINDGTGVFTDMTHVCFPGLKAKETREVDAGDLDGDGDADLFMSNVVLFQKYDATPQLLINNGKGVFTDETSARFQLKVDRGYIDADLVDLENDGDLDIVLGGLDGLTIMINNGNGIFSDRTLEITGSKYPQMIIDVEIADFNSDGIPDIYAGTYRTGDLLFMGKKRTE